MTEGVPAPSRTVTTVAVGVRDYDEALAFYVGVLGLELIEDTALGASKRWVVVGSHAGARILLARATTPAQEGRVGDQTGGRVFLFLETDDLACDHAAYAAAGVRFVEGPRSEPYGRVAVFEDLYGNRWDLIERRPAG